jgi:hypothetical protein
LTVVSGEHTTRRLEPAVQGSRRRVATTKEGFVTAALATTPLTAADRCDRCGAQAYLRVLLMSGGELLFCAHHGREHADALRMVASDIQDETHQLVAAPTAALGER